MKTRLKKPVIIFITLLLIIGSTFSAGGTDTVDIQSESSRLEQEKAATLKRLETLKEQKSSVEEYIRSLDVEMSSLTNSITEIEQELVTLQELLLSTQEQLEELQSIADGQYEAMKLRIRYMYENGDTTYLEMLLSAESMADFLNKAEYISELAEYDNTMLHKYKESLEAIEANQTILLETQDTLLALMDESEMKKASLELVSEAKQQELLEYDDQISVAEGEINNYDDAINEAEAQVAALVAQIEKEEQERLESEQAEQAVKSAEESSRAAEESRQQSEEASVQASLDESKAAETALPDTPAGEDNTDETLTQGEPTATETPATTAAATTAAPTTASPTTAESTQAAASTDLDWTWPAPSCRVITDGYGGSRNHKGIDISKNGGSLNETIVAAASGTVVWAAYSSSAGNWIVIYHGKNASGQGVYTCYMHCNSLSVSSGQKVTAGQAIGAIGNTGASNGAHLHFEIRLGGFTTSAATVNPTNYVSP